MAARTWWPQPILTALHQLATHTTLVEQYHDYGLAVVEGCFNFDRADPTVVAALYPPENDDGALLFLRPGLADDLRIVLLQECWTRLDRHAAGEGEGFRSFDAGLSRPVALLWVTVDPPSGQG